MYRIRVVVFCSAILCGPFVARDVAQSQDTQASESGSPEPRRAETKEENEVASTGSDQSEVVQTQVPVPKQEPTEQNSQTDHPREQSQVERGGKPLLADAETAPSPPVKPILAEPRDKKEDDTVWPKADVRARVMTGWEYKSERPAEAQQRESDSEQQFFLQQARVGLKAELNKRVYANISADLSDGLRPVASSLDYEEIPYLRNAYINVRIKKAFQIRAGRFKRPFSRLENTSTGILPFRGRGLSNSLIIEETQWGDRAIGLMLWGKIRKLNLTWKGSVSNPDWAADNDMEMNGIDTIGQLIYQPVKWASVGINYGHKLIKPTENRSINVDAIGGDFGLRFGGFRFSAEAFAAQLSQEENEPFAFGVLGYASYDYELLQDFVLQPTLFGEYADANSDYSQTEAIRTVIGINLLFYENLRVLPQVEIVRTVGKVSNYNPWISGENIYVLFSLRI